ncbi:DHA2 family efflux MFS transporter permease subunit [Streptomyces cellulosae]|uniref:EmrB/QacA subfamily drug resistance transporter n=1 Tax=Streptomyces thermodiastaticus TaxID=44061 RepID=A0ABU0KM92_9ACTN|nr:EmrB/QacA subfamily drug resistance transporter [Streptomyces thermodiastaticus]UVT08553.1 DHA2 family efflux MFS transporter permease subunit [Streptomyces thermocarboxydus]WSB40164.1 DHA2 family efflux MFS transporter permease subunit [Streptomyces cellulosae]WTC20017.1 DHA2 family efflux MFS transporter permease subunit [Streptomyces cellulosae]WTF19170.1 DHA2 family efflux MFS transporter permease subunit [Streptomyces cellulosae]
MTSGTLAPGAEPSTAGKTLLLTSAATFMAFLDTTIVNVAFPALHEDFPKESVTDLTWVVTSYGILFAALLTPAGRFADVLGRRKLFLWSVALFSVASLACAVAPNVELLIAARAVQGIGAAGMIPAALGLVLSETPAEKRAEAIGIWGAAGSMAAAAGPSLGGLLVSEIDWRAVFVLNIPIGIAVLLGALRLPERPAENSKLPDLLGTATVTLGIAGIVIGLTKGGDWGWDAVTTWAWIGAGVLLVAFSLLRSGKHPAPAVETGLWGTSMFAAANLTAFLLGAGLFVWFLSGPLYLTTIWGYSVLKAGLAVTPGAVLSAVAAIAVGRRLKPEQQRPVVIVSAAAFLALSIWAYTGLGSDREFLALWLPYGALGGAVLGAALTSVTTAASISVHPLKFATGTGMSTTARQFGGAVGVASMAAVFAAGDLSTPQPYLDAFLLAGIYIAASAVPGFWLFTKKSMAQIAETQRQIQAHMRAQAEAAAKAAAAASSADRS